MPNEEIAVLVSQLEQVLLGKKLQIKLALCCIFAKGHLLIEDLPGMGKTSLCHALAQGLSLSYQRIQFTSDMLPADILGVTIFDNQQNKFEFHPGPIFKQMLLADEINRASPKTQSALLEAMAEKQITVDGETYPLPQPFFVIATQNPSDQSGTFPLPESQLDRFMMRLSIGYPDTDSEMAMLKQQSNETTASVRHCLNASSLQAVQRSVDNVTASDSLLKYILALVNASRNKNESVGLSPRATKAILQAAKAWALLSGRQYVVPEDVQIVFPHVAEHRIRQNMHQQGQALSTEILTQVNPIL
ncbi:MoxR protein [Shewanella piezotolerans WP3]|uniref:MoxR protein n=1 Tax=Shewanella piezotolerans (strain WP3 / JCM 13877) TaxID=225849 RepID=B8CMV2_SHEPW|nr:MoxR family ATPase [Shewanella piezotolerans]ACJ29492.1 MoxR protein [Shewanella piezotolerans WP3]